MKISKLFAFALIGCLSAGCSDNSLVISKNDKTTCEGKNCSQGQQDPENQDPENQDPENQDPTVDPPKPEIPPEDAPCNGADLKTDPNNCGTCGFSCGEGTCHDGLCVCNDNWLDCNGDGTCETEGKCECTAGETKPCYEGDEGTAGIGVCKNGYLTCIIDDSGAYWDIGNCVGQVLPAQDSSGYICDITDPNRDNDCNGIPDSIQDDDKDGYPICQNGSVYDCCDNEKMCNTTRPDLIHPGVSRDCNGNNLDDNCNGIMDEDDISCDQAVTCEGDDCETQACQFDYGDCDINLKWNNSNDNSSALLLAKSMDICMGTTSDPNKGTLLEYSLHRSGSNMSINSAQVNILNGMKDKSGKTLIKPRIGQSFAVLSSGAALDVYHGAGNGDRQFSKGDTPPNVYLKAHGNKLESHPNCSAGSTTKINDSVVLHLKMKAPQNAKGFSFDFRFFSREYPVFLCTTYNDFFLTLLTDENGAPLVNDDGNISFDKKGNAVSVNNAFFTTCVAPSCSGANSCPGNFDEGCQKGHCGQCDSPDDLYAYTSTPYNGNNGDGGGTAWLTTSAPISGGQIFNLDFYIWDTYDQILDSSVILDNFQWLCDATLNTGFAPPIDNPIN